MMGLPASLGAQVAFILSDMFTMPLHGVRRIYSRPELGTGASCPVKMIDYIEALAVIGMQMSYGRGMN